VDVGGVAGKEHAAGPVAGGVAVVEPEVGQPCRVAQAQPATGEAVDDGLQVAQRGRARVVLAAIVAAGRWPHADHAPGRRPAEREAEQHPGRPREHMDAAGLQAAVDLEVGEHEGARVGGTPEGDAGEVAHGAVGAVAADQVAGSHPLGPAVVVAQRADQLLVVLVGVDAGQLHAPLDGDATRGQVLAEHGFGLGLGEEQQERVGGVVQADVEQPQRHRVAAGVHLQVDGVVAPFDQGLGDAEAAEDLEGARLDGQRARLVHAVVLAVDDPGAGAVGVELRGQRQAGGAGTDDEHVELLAAGRVAGVAAGHRVSLPCGWSGRDRRLGCGRLRLVGGWPGDWIELVGPEFSG